MRARSSSNKKSKRREEQEAAAKLLAQATAPRIADATNGGKHINFFEDLEQVWIELPAFVFYAYFCRMPSVRLYSDLENWIR